MRLESSVHTEPDALKFQAASALRAGQFLEAEMLYRQILPLTNRKALVNFQIFLCLIRQGCRKEAEAAKRFMAPPPRGSVPAWFYAEAVLAAPDGYPPEDDKFLADAHRIFPLICQPYDEALADAGKPNVRSLSK